MSLCIALKGPEGLVLAADTRITLTRQFPDGQTMSVNYDNASKLLTLDAPHTGFAALTYGSGTIGLRTAHSLMPEFQEILGKDPRSVSEYTAKLSDFFFERWRQMGMPQEPIFFLTGGVNPHSPYGEIYSFDIPDAPTPTLWYPDSFGMRWGGQLEVVSRLMQGFDSNLTSVVSNRYPTIDVGQLDSLLRSQLEFTIPYEFLPLQDCIDLAIFLIRTTITAQSLSTGLRGVGGTIEVVTITPQEGLQWVQKRQIHGEKL